MFDVGFSELVVIALVALIVIGPERLPKVARTVGHLLGRLQRYVGDVKADISREMQLEELKKLQEQVAGEARAMEQQVNEQMATVDASLNNSILQGIEDKSAAAGDSGVASAGHLRPDGLPVPPAPTFAEAPPVAPPPEVNPPLAVAPSPDKPA